jgi:ABC-type transport system substrate-binding protein
VYGQQFASRVEATLAMFNDVGIRARATPEDYQTEWLPKTFSSRGDFDGIALGPSARYPDAGEWISAHFHSSASRSKLPEGYDREFDRLIENIRNETDGNKRTERIKEYQRYAANKMLYVSWTGAATGFNLTWPWVGNNGVYRTSSQMANPTELLIYTWLDTTKMRSS